MNLMVTCSSTRDRDFSRLGNRMGRTSWASPSDAHRVGPMRCHPSICATCIRARGLRPLSLDHHVPALHSRPHTPSLVSPPVLGRHNRLAWYVLANKLYCLNLINLIIHTNLISLQTVLNPASLLRTSAAVAQPTTAAFANHKPTSPLSAAALQSPAPAMTFNRQRTPSQAPVLPS